MFRTHVSNAWKIQATVDSEFFLIHKEAGMRFARLKPKLRLVVTKNQKSKVNSSHEAEEKRRVRQKAPVLFQPASSIKHYLIFYALNTFFSYTL